MYNSRLVAKPVKDPASLESVRDLLKASNLPFDDLRLDNSLFVRYYDSNKRMVGSGGLEFYSSDALLRSVAVVESERGKSVGDQIISDLLVRANERSIKEIYLLTETAHDFFLHRGFADIERERVPAEVKASAEFTSICPASAACMVYRIARK